MADENSAVETLYNLDELGKVETASEVKKPSSETTEATKEAEESEDVNEEIEEAETEEEEAEVS